MTHHSGVRVHELAKIAGDKSSDFIKKLSGLGIEVKSHMSSLEMETAVLVCHELGLEPPAEVAEYEKAHAATTTAAPKAAKEAAAPKAKEPKPADKKTKTPAASKPESEKSTSADVCQETSESDTDGDKKIYVNKPIVLKDLAELMDLKPNDLIKQLISCGVFASINQLLDIATVELVVSAFGFALSKEADPTKSKEKTVAEQPKEQVKAQDLKTRPPVVTFMGHVDHGKTTLLDYIKSSSVAQKEFGGITQHIGAYSVETDNGDIVFLDTPGHAAFSALRARGANMTDIVVLVVAADDGPKQQTIEALNHARAAGVPIIVAINKIDRPNVSLDIVKKQLLSVDIIPEDMGGEIICCPVSGISGEGIDHLIEMILLQAEIMELKGNPTAKMPTAAVVESQLCKGKGPVVTVITKEGTLRRGQFFVCDQYYGKIKSMKDFRNRDLKETTPSYPAEISGLSGVPEPGSMLEVCKNEKEAKSISNQRAIDLKHKEFEADDELTWQEQVLMADIQELKLIVKADVQGSLEAIVAALENLSTEDIAVKIIHKGIGDIIESDVMLATASNACMIGFNVKYDSKIRDLAKRNRVEMKLYRIIYDLTDDMEKILTGMIEPEEIETVLGTVQVRQLFKLSKAGKVLGCYVTDGKVTRKSKIRIYRGEELMGDARISSLKRFKDEVKEVAAGFECGIKLDTMSDIAVEDTLQAYIVEAKEVEK